MVTSNTPADADAPATDPGDEAATGGRLLTDPRLDAVVLLSAVGVFGNQAVPAILPSIGAGLGLPDARIGLVMTAFYLPTMVFVPITAIVSDIYGRRPVVLTSLLAFGLAGVAVLGAGSLEALLALRAIQGAALAGLTPLAVALLGDFFDGTTGTAAQGIRSSAHGIVIILAPAIAGVLAGLNWRYPFLLYGAAFPAFVLVYVYLPEGVRDRRNGDVGARLREYAGSIVEALRDRNMAVLIAGGFTLFFVRYGMLTTVPLLATRRLGASAAETGLALSALGVVRIVVAPLSGRFVARVSRRPAAAATTGVLAASLAALAVVPTLPAMVAAVALFGVGMALLNPLLNDTVTAIAPASERAGVVSSLHLFKNLATTVAPTAFTVALAATGFAVVFAAGAAVALVYVAVVVAFFEPAPA
ncbi:MAG: MFS transporter [Haloferacaceae archaeon]